MILLPTGTTLSAEHVASDARNRSHGSTNLRTIRRTQQNTPDEPTGPQVGSREPVGDVSATAVTIENTLGEWIPEVVKHNESLQIAAGGAGAGGCSGGQRYIVCSWCR